MTSILVANMIEFNARRINASFTPEERRIWRVAGNDLGDMALLWEGDNKIVVSPSPFDTEWLTDVVAWMGWQNVTNVSPRRRSDSLCDDVLSDEDLLDTLKGYASHSTGCQLIGWGATPELYRLRDSLGYGTGLLSEELPHPNDYWVVEYLDSKTGFRELISQLRLQHSSLRIPRGFTVATMPQALAVVAHFVRERSPFVLKAYFGVGGFGVLIRRPEDLAGTVGDVLDGVIKELEDDHIFETGSLTVEEYVHLDLSDARSCPTYDAQILPDGSVSTVGVGAMIMQDQFYRGVVAGAGVVESGLERQIIASGQIVGSAMAELGYRGWFDIDFLRGSHGELYLSEINTRRTSPTHVFQALEELNVHDNTARVALANDHFLLGIERPIAYSDVRGVFARLNTKPTTDSCRYIPTIVTSLGHETPYLGYVVTGPDYDVVRVAKSQLETALRQAVTSGAR